MHSQTQLATTEASRIAKRLFNHWKHKFEVAETEHSFQILMPTATVTLTPQNNTLDVSIQSQLEPAEQTRLEGVVIDHLNRMAQQEFHVTWQQQA
ncbi:DUF2218 domain-containing protein [Acinetobacter sp. ANC 4633]|uniref:DUF2218 domain-containing protein n=1 Tax=Acinetobacter sp. ANC 4633 TaxID=2529845 RepID=UPI00103C306E|nr:DUF2218 domain-containing protein [Acinetobacter sp. ANC 4633]TCB26519.1 DUF2218 domain-containing protein [Acinetobacter sp. ANC 4633]